MNTDKDRVDVRESPVMSSSSKARCAAAERSLGTARKLLSGLNGLETQKGGEWVEEGKTETRRIIKKKGKLKKGASFAWMTPVQYKCSIHCCFCIQPLDSVKCFNICAILERERKYTLAKSVQLYRQ